MGLQTSSLSLFSASHGLVMDVCSFCFPALDNEVELVFQFTDILVQKDLQTKLPFIASRAWPTVGKQRPPMLVANLTDVNSSHHSWLVHSSAVNVPRLDCCCDVTIMIALSPLHLLC